MRRLHETWVFSFRNNILDKLALQIGDLVSLMRSQQMKRTQFVSVLVIDFVLLEVPKERIRPWLLKFLEHEKV